MYLRKVIVIRNELSQNFSLTIVLGSDIRANSNIVSKPIETVRVESSKVVSNS